MADEKEAEDKDEEQGEEAAPKKGKKGLFLGGGILSLVALAYILSMMAVPGEEKEIPFEGPFVIGLAPAQGKVQVNLSGASGKRYLVMTLKAEYDAYQEAYATARVADPLYVAMEKDALIKVSRKKSSGDLEDPVGEEIFKQEVRDAIDPLLFPIHVGNEASATAGHEESGLRAGRSISMSSMRGGFHGHAFEIDAAKGTIRLDEGPEVTFEGHEQDLLVENDHGESVYVDVSALVPDFAGRVNVGTFGRVKNIYFDQFLVQ